MFLLLNPFRGRKPMEWSATQSVIVGRVWPSLDNPGHWILAGERSDSNREGRVVARLNVERELAAGDVLELDVEGDWSEGVLSVGEFIGLVFHTPNFDKIESLESLSRRDARVRKVRR